jgi:hypothetical protein
MMMLGNSTKSYKDTVEGEVSYIMGRFSRGNVRLQDGCYILQPELDKMLSKSDKALGKLVKLSHT